MNLQLHIVVGFSVRNFYFLKLRVYGLRLPVSASPYESKADSGGDQKPLYIVEKFEL